jgi:hypothetical protein
VSIQIRLDDADQTTAILVEGDCVTVQAFYGDPRDEKLSDPGAPMHYGAEGVERLITALFSARIAMERESVGEFFQVMTNGFGCEAS